MIAQKARLRSVEDTTGTVAKAAILVVKFVNSDWFWVSWSNGYGTVKGWIYRTDIVPYSQALAFFTRELAQNPTAVAYNTRERFGMSVASMTGPSRISARRSGSIPTSNSSTTTGVSPGTIRRTTNRRSPTTDRATELDPRYSLVFNNRGNAWSALQDYGRAIADYSEAIRLDPKDPSAFFNRAHAWSVRQEYEKAIADFDEAIRLDGKDAIAYKSRGSAWCAKSEYRQGARRLQ